jgi:multiple sugar transport system permease protein/putative spermidine/putrescine transport system permease protein
LKIIEVLIGGVKFETVAVVLFKELGDKYLVPTTGAVITLVLLTPALVIFFVAARLVKENVMAAGMGKL